MRRHVKTFFRASAQVLLAVCISAPLIMIVQGMRSPGHRTLHVLCTNDVHGAWFDSSYVGGGLQTSLQNVSWYVDSIRKAEGAGNVLLLDAGDCLQGDGAAFYYNFVDTLTTHLYVRMAKYMAYDAIVVGNHDIETGHKVYDRVSSLMSKFGIAYLAGNTPTPDGSPYFQEYKLFRRAGMKVLVLGYTNANIKNWLGEEKWRGMDFSSLLPLVQERVDAIRRKTKPDVVIVAVHSGTGEGNGLVLENQGLDLFNSLRGVDLVVCAHDHRQYTCMNDSIALVNSGKKASFIAHAEICASGKNRGKVKSTGLLKVRTDREDSRMVSKFYPDFLKVKEYVNRKVGRLDTELRTSDAYVGMSDYMNFIHSVQLKYSGADISFAAPLTYNGIVKSGDVVFQDLTTIYPFENLLYKIELKGSQIKDYLECSYDSWIGGDSSHILNVIETPDTKSGWSFVGRSYNFDSAAGIVYEVWAEKPFGQRIKIVSMADGTAFDPAAVYSVAVTSYRSSGGGGLLVNGAGVPAEKLDAIVVARYPDIRELVNDYFSEYGTVDSASAGDRSVIGHWSFEPASVREKIVKDKEMLFGK